jgi:predicted  nucleic acid-binding Zn-ribbon protein
VRPVSSRQIKRGMTRAVQAAAAGALAGAAVHSLARLNTAAAHPDIVYQVNSLQSSLDELESRADMSEVRADIANLDANLTHALSLLESAREKGYKYQSDLEHLAYDAMTRWQAVRNEVEESIEEQARQASQFYAPVNQQVNQLNNLLGSAGSALGALGQTEGQVRQALQSVAEAERRIESVYDEIERQAGQLTVRLTRIHWALTQFFEASLVSLKDENLYMAVKARWDQAGSEDPEGILFLTSQRLIFEQKEKVATKKVLFIATAKELVQKVLGAQPLSAVQNVLAQNKGVFSHQDFLEVDFGKQRVAFHLDGQSSEDWAGWIKNAKSGKIKEEKTSGSKLSFSDLTGKLTQANILELQNEINELQDELMLRDTQEEISELENQVMSLSRELAELRARGYVVEKSIEADVEILILQWEKIKARAKTTLDYQTGQLGGQMKEIQSGMAQLAGLSGSLASARPAYINLKSLIASAEAQAEAAEETVLDQYDEYAEEIEMLDAHLEWVDWMLDALSMASFKLLATESGVAAVEAVWERPGLPPENGILYLTDQRLLWEDRVEDFELKIDVPLAQVGDVKQSIGEEDGLQQLRIELGPGAPVHQAEFVLSLPVAEAWLQMIGRAKAGDYVSDRAVEIDASLIERIQNAPTQCSNCGATFTAPILRGQEVIVCEFCGVNTRI